MDQSEGFRFDYAAPTLCYGRGAVDDLGTELAGLDCDRTLVVCGRTVGDTPAVMDPVRAGLGDRLVGVFAGTTPEKRLDTAVACAERMRAADVDALVGVGGGSSLDVAKVASVLAAAEEGPEVAAERLAASGAIGVPADVVPLAAVPTTLAGADLSTLAGITLDPAGGPDDRPETGGVGDPALMPDVAVYDPHLVATTPRGVLAGSALNGFDKGIETLYARNWTPITDATAVRGLELLRDGLPTLRAPDSNDWDLDAILQGIVLVQYGISRADGTTLSVIHALGHGLRAHGGVQQGVAHAVVAPHALDWLFERVDGRRDLLADALGVPAGSPDERADGVVSVVRELRDELSLPAHLRDVEGVERSQFDAIAETTAQDYLLANAPEGLDTSAEEFRTVLDAAW